MDGPPAMTLVERSSSSSTAAALPRADSMRAHALAQNISAQCGVPGGSFRPRGVKPLHPGWSSACRSGLSITGRVRVTDGMAPRIEGRVVLIDDVMTSGQPPNARFAALSRREKVSICLVFARPSEVLLPCPHFGLRRRRA